MLLNKLLKKKLLPLHHIMYTTEMLQLKKERKKERKLCVFPIFNKSIYGLFDLPEKQEVYYCNLTQKVYVKLVINTSTIYQKTFCFLYYHE